tara:strand:- start:1383 stop:2063 length:681 start_codon:yes stop_codon:yes gene_type:complete
MAISINTVYQRVLALANKEQRGYITPQDFNLFANQAQLEILEQYFYDINQFGRMHGNNTNFSDMVDLINDKLNVLKVTETLSNIVDAKFDLPSDFFRMGNVILNGMAADQVTRAEVMTMSKSRLTKPTRGNPVYTISGNEVQIWGWTQGATYEYIKKPTNVNWGYVIVNEVAMYNPGDTTDFELHALEETELVYRILALSGISIKRPDIASTANALLQAKNQQEKI